MSECYEIFLLFLPFYYLCWIYLGYEILYYKYRVGLDQGRVLSPRDRIQQKNMVSCLLSGTPAYLEEETQLSSDTLLMNTMSWTCPLLAEG